MPSHAVAIVALFVFLAFAAGIAQPFAAAIQPRLQQIIEAGNDVNP